MVGWSTYLIEPCNLSPCLQSKLAYVTHTAVCILLVRCLHCRE